eukprot:tig00020531_g10002.t1
MALTDCKYFARGSCNRGGAGGPPCKFRHQAGVPKICTKWLKGRCSQAQCPMRHPPFEADAPAAAAGGRAPAGQGRGAHAQPTPSPDFSSSTGPTAASLGLGNCVAGAPVPIGIFWDIENCSVPRQADVLQIVDSVRSKTREACPGGQEALFRVYGNMKLLHDSVSTKLKRLGVSMSHVPHTGKPNEADIEIINDVLEFASRGGPPGAVVFITGDVDYSSTISMLRHRRGWQLVLFHRRNSRSELLVGASVAHCWEDVVVCGQPQSPPKLQGGQPGAAAGGGAEVAGCSRQSDAGNANSKEPARPAGGEGVEKGESKGPLQPPTTTPSSSPPPPQKQQKQQQQVQVQATAQGGGQARIVDMTIRSGLVGDAAAVRGAVAFFLESQGTPALNVQTTRPQYVEGQSGRVVVTFESSELAARAVTFWKRQAPRGTEIELAVRDVTENVKAPGPVQQKDAVVATVEIENVYSSAGKCVLCGQAFKTREGCLQHATNKHTMCACSGCPLVFGDDRAREEHEARAHFECPACFEIFKDAEQRTVHMARMHSGVDFEQCEREIACSTCFHSEALYKTLAAFDDHLIKRKCSGGQYFRCLQCPRLLVFPGALELERHLTEVHSMNGINACLSCPSCHRCMDQWRLLQHMRDSFHWVCKEPGHARRVHGNAT